MMNRRFVGYFGVACLLLLCSPTFGQSHRTDHVALLGVVTVPAKGGAKVVHVLEQSPADVAGLTEGDLLFRLHSGKIASPLDVDDSLKTLGAGAEIKIGYIRDGKKKHTRATLVSRADYRGDSLKRRPRGSVGFPAPEWYGFAWRNLNRGQRPPTKERTAGKIVVFHCFQSW